MHSIKAELIIHQKSKKESFKEYLCIQPKEQICEITDFSNSLWKVKVEYVTRRCQLTSRTVAAGLHEHEASGEKISLRWRSLSLYITARLSGRTALEEYTQRAIFTLEMNNLMIFLKCYLIMSLWWVMYLSRFKLGIGSEEKASSLLNQNTAEKKTLFKARAHERKGGLIFM